MSFQIPDSQNITKYPDYVGKLYSKGWRHGMLGGDITCFSPNDKEHPAWPKRAIVFPHKNKAEIWILEIKKDTKGRNGVFIKNKFYYNILSTGKWIKIKD